MGIQVYGNINGFNTGGTNIDMRGIGTDITSAMSDTSDTNHKILTGMGPDSFRHNGKSGGISDLAGNVWECVDGLQLNTFLKGGDCCHQFPRLQVSSREK